MAKYTAFALTIFTACAALGVQAQAAPVTNLSSYATSWAGSFDGRRIGLFIESIQQGKVTGYSLLGATKQGFVGTVKPEGANTYKLKLTETGSPATAGVFELTLDSSNTNVLEASWQSSQANVKPKFFSLSKQQCGYKPNVGDYPEGSTRLLKDSDLQVSKQQLQFMRNEIYARHNYSFSNREVAAYYAEADWYIPCSLDVASQLTKTEKENIRRIQLMEPYAENMDWGR